MDIHGTVAAGFEPVADAFAANFAEHGDVGAACCVYRHGEPVVDIWGGLADARTSRPWRRDTPVVTFSSTKGITAICVHRLVEGGVLDLDAPVANYWPEFGANGKEDIPLRWVLSHRAGVATVDAQVSIEDVVGWHGVVDPIAGQSPNWEPGTAHGYHARTFGWILGEVVRRATGRTLGTYLAEEIARPLGLDVWIGLPDEIEPRLATLIPPDPPNDPHVADLMHSMAMSDTLFGRVMSGPSHLFAYDDRWNWRPLHKAEMPSSNGVATATGLARLYAATVADVDGLRLLSPQTVEAARVPQTDGPDCVLGLETRFSLGFAVPPFLSSTAEPTMFGHPGAGGSLGLADPESGLALGYVMNKMRLDPTDPDLRAANLVGALRQCR